MGPVLVGTSSWSARTLVHDSTWYPRRSMKASERLAYYAARFALVEVDSTARFPPTPDVCRQWAERSPDGFVFDVQAWSLLTGRATLPESLWEDLRDQVRPEARDRPRLYAGHLSAEALAEAWARFRHALEPLRAAGRLGAVVLRYPHWLRPGGTGRGLLRQARLALDDVELVVELAHPGWLDGRECEETLAFLEDHRLGLACTDAVPDRLVLAATSDVAFVRLRGFGPEYPSVRRYAREELAAWVPRLRDLAESAPVHVVLSNMYQDFAVRGAEELQELVARCRA